MYVNPVPTTKDWQATLEKFKGYYCPKKILIRTKIKESCFK